MHDIAVNDCFNENSESTLFCRYAVYKHCLEYEPYLRYVKNDKYRTALSKLRLCANNLKVNTGIRNHLNIDNKICELCDHGQVEDEHHFLLQCSYYDELRRELFPQSIHYWHSEYHFNKLMSSLRDNDLMYRIGKFTYLALEKRKRYYLNEL